MGNEEVDVLLEKLLLWGDVCFQNQGCNYLYAGTRPCSYCRAVKSEGVYEGLRLHGCRIS